MPARTAALLTATAAAAGVVALAGCSASASFHIGTTPSLPKSQVERLTAQKLAASTHQPVPTVSCPSDLKGKVGTTLDCTLTDRQGTKYAVVVKTTSVKDGKIGFDAKVTHVIH